MVHGHKRVFLRDAGGYFNRKSERRVCFRFGNMTKAEKREAELSDLRASINELAGHIPFQKFLKAVADLREIAINDACLFEQAKNPNTTYGAIGRIQAYQEMLDLVEQYKPQPEDESLPPE